MSLFVHGDNIYKKNTRNRLKINESMAGKYQSSILVKLEPSMKNGKQLIWL